MTKLEGFIDMITGVFDNNTQYTKELSTGSIVHPKARHIKGVCNNKIKNLPAGFKGYFVIAESYYDSSVRTTMLLNLFLYDLTSDNKVRLCSYDMPKDVPRHELRNDIDELSMDYSFLTKSDKIKPLIYNEDNDEYFGESISNISKDIKFTLTERVTKSALYINETIEKNGKVVMGFDEPIIYERVT